MLQILFDQTRVTKSFSKHGVTVSAESGTAMSLEIPDIGVSITFDGKVFQIQLPAGLFGHNTEGQCGERRMELGQAGPGGEQPSGQAGVLRAQVTGPVPNRYLHQQSGRRVSPPGWHSGPQLPGHGRLLAGAREQQGGLWDGAQPSTPHQHFVPGAQYALVHSVPPRTAV